MVAHVADGFGCGCAVSVCRIEFHAPGVVRGLESAPLVTGDSVKYVFLTVVDPSGHLTFRIAQVAGGHAKEESLLARGADQIAHDVTKDLAEPWTAGEHVLIG